MSALDWPARRARPHVKICGITRPDLGAAAIRLGASMIGLVHFPPSPRHLSVEDAAAVAAAADGAMVVALTVDADDNTLDRLMSDVRPDALQLHGKESPERVASLRGRFGIPIAKAVGVASVDDVAATQAYDALLVLDAKPPKGADRPGGHGATFDWSILNAMPAERPYMLSGGLRPDNVAAAIEAIGPYALDVSSGVEIDGVKDVERMAAFMRAVKEAGQPAPA